VGELYEHGHEEYQGLCSCAHPSLRALRLPTDPADPELAEALAAANFSGAPATDAPFSERRRLLGRRLAQVRACRLNPQRPHSCRQQQDATHALGSARGRMFTNRAGS
jgi:hypothetical protein